MTEFTSISSQNAGSNFIIHDWKRHYDCGDYEMAAIGLYDSFVTNDETDTGIERMAKVIKNRPKIALYLGRELPNEDLKRLIEKL